MVLVGVGRGQSLRDEQMSRPPPRDAGQRAAGARQHRPSRPQKPQPFAGLLSDVPPDTAPLQLTVFGLPADLHVRDDLTRACLAHCCRRCSRIVMCSSLVPDTSERHLSPTAWCSLTFGL